MYIGTDIVKVSRMEGLLKNGVPAKVFTEYEKEYINSKSDKLQTAAGLYAAKEAVLKAMGKGITLPLNDVCIKHRSTGEPFIELSGDTYEFSKKIGIESISISISHDGEYAISTAYACVNKYFEYYKKALDKFLSSPDNAIRPEIISKLITKRNSDTHKGNYGKLYILAGSVGLTGAAVMSCNSALKCGAGLITLGCASELNSIFECKLTEVMTKPLDSLNGIITDKDIGTILKDVSSADVCLIGPGLGRNDDIRSIIRSVLENTTTPCIIDADGLNAISLDIEMLNDRKCELILTPHIAEFASLCGIDKSIILKHPYKYAKEFATKYKVILVLKSHQTIVATPNGDLFINILGNPGMATGGTGDVLAGCIASFAVQGINLCDAALVGVYIHSLAGDMASYEKGEYSLTPSDIIDFLPYAIKNYS